MKRMLLLAMMVSISFSGRGMAGEEDRTEIRRVLVRSYVEGVFVLRDPDLVRQGFSANFVMQVLENGKVRTLTLEEWLDRLELNRTLSQATYTSQITLVDIMEDAAVARVEILENSEPKLTDYFSLYHTEEGWKIVSMTFHHHR